MEREKNAGSSFLEWAKSFLIAIVLAVVIKLFIFSPYTVYGDSMKPTLHNGERMLVNKAPARMLGLQRGDIVILRLKNDSRYYVKRLIGLPGEIIEMKNDRLFINGKPVKEPYVSRFKREAEEKGMLFTGDFGPIQIPGDKYYVLGDNRLKSMDSRNGLGLAEKSEIVGKSEYTIYPLDHIRKTK